MLEFDISQIKDSATKAAIQRLRDAFREQPFLRGEWEFFEITFTKAQDNFKYPHGFDFVPKDVLQTYISTDTAVIWNFHLFDRNNLDITIAAPCTVRAFIGRFEQSGVV